MTCLVFRFKPPLGETGEVAYSWSTLLGVHIPIPSVIHKMESLGMTQLLVISIIAGFLHLGLGLLIGVIVERKHNRKHAITKIGLLFVLTALALLIFVMADWTIGQWLKPLKDSAVAPFLWNYLHPACQSRIFFRWTSCSLCLSRVWCSWYCHDHYRNRGIRLSRSLRSHQSSDVLHEACSYLCRKSSDGVCV